MARKRKREYVDIYLKMEDLAKLRKGHGVRLTVAGLRYAIHAGDKVTMKIRQLEKQIRQLKRKPFGQALPPEEFRKEWNKKRKYTKKNELFWTADGKHRKEAV